MPDDTEIAERSEEEPSSEFDDAFSAAMEDAIEGKPVKEPEEKDGGDAEAEAESKAEEETKAEEERLEKERLEKEKLEANETEEEKQAREAKEKDEDEAEKRGKELLEENAKTKLEQEEADRVAREEKEKREAEEKAAAGPEPVTEEHIKVLGSILPEDQLPDAIEVDGVSIDLKDYVNEYPEAKVLMGLTLQRGIENLVKTGTLVTGEQHRQEMEALSQRFSDDLYDLQVNIAHPDAGEIVDSDEFKKWSNEQSAATKALFGSPTPSDFIIGLTKYKDSLGTKQAEEADIEAKKKKDAHDKLYSDTAGKSATKPKATTSGDSEQSYGDAFNEAMEKADKKEA